MSPGHNSAKKEKRVAAITESSIIFNLLRYFTGRRAHVFERLDLAKIRNVIYYVETSLTADAQFEVWSGEDLDALEDSIKYLKGKPCRLKSGTVEDV